MNQASSGASGYLSSTDWNTFNGKATAPPSTSNILKGNGSGGFATATSGLDYAPATSGSAILKGNGAGGFTSAVSGTDYYAPGGALGTPLSGTLSSCTGYNASNLTGALPVAQGGTGTTSLGTGISTFLTTPTSANLKAAVTDETGSGGALVFATGPTLSGVTLNGTTTIPASQTLSVAGPATFTGVITSQAYNFAPTTSWYLTGTTIFGAINNLSLYTFTSTGTANATLWNSTSDARIKENVTPVTNGVATVNALNPVKFSFKQDHLSEPNQYGLIAQELQQVVPEVVSPTGLDVDGIEDVLGISYSSLIPILIKAVQELSAEVEALKAKVG